MHEPSMTVEGLAIPVTCANTVIVGAGAAGLNCAVQLVEFWRRRGVDAPHTRVLVVTGGLSLGASRMSGSDKQTYYKLGTSPRVPDTAEDFAHTLTAFGCCHGDNALAEGIGSLRGFYHLIEAGVPFPHDPYGAFIGYKTDHDPYERATSAGPKTSRFMAERLAAKAKRHGVKFLDKHVVADFITEGDGQDRRIVGLACLRRGAREDLPLRLLVAENWVLAAGGPGQIYQSTVYPRRQIGIHGPALKAGLEMCNLTESQYGLASVKFRWNVSGTYMQVVPRIFSTNARGADEREFLTEYFTDMPALATNIFLKGYQWPFDAQRIANQQSSLVDMAVHQETVVRGRRVWMDFLRNPAGRPGWEEFRIDRLGSEAQEYLRRTGAVQGAPIERLAHMNSPAIGIYAENGIDLRREPLEIALCAQHHNGGFSVNKWWESSLPHTFVIGEMAGTHGVKRPGGSALNAGQVGALRAAEYIAGVYGCDQPELSRHQAALQAGLAETIAFLRGLLAKARSAPGTPAQAMKQLGQRMTRHAAHLRSRRGSAEALEQGKQQYRRLLEQGLKLRGPSDLADAVTTIQQCLTHVAMLKAICGMFDRGAGSRGSHCILADDGIPMHPALVDPGTGQPYRFRPENQALRNVILTARYDASAPDLFTLGQTPPRPIPQRDVAFEVAWAQYRQGDVYRLE